jgi:hypothetical protein
MRNGLLGDRLTPEQGEGRDPEDHARVCLERVEAPADVTR